MRSFCLLLLIFAACNDEPETTATSTTKTSKPDGKAKELVSPATGMVRIQESHKTYADLYAEEEKKDKPSAVSLRQIIKGCKTLTIVLELSIESETTQTTRLKHGRMRQELATLDKQRLKAVTEAVEIQTMLDEDAKKIKPIPTGFTRAELEDRLADVREGQRKIDAQLKKHRAEMTKVEKLLNSGASLTPGDTMATRELEAVNALRKKAEALLAQ